MFAPDLLLLLHAHHRLHREHHLLSSVLRLVRSSRALFFVEGDANDRGAILDRDDHIGPIEEKFVIMLA